jgi:hypothetical protein
VWQGKTNPQIAAAPSRWSKTSCEAYSTSWVSGAVWNWLFMLPLTGVHARAEGMVGCDAAAPLAKAQIA